MNKRFISNKAIRKVKNSVEKIFTETSKISDQICPKKNSEELARPMYEPVSAEVRHLFIILRDIKWLIYKD